jgi:ubiquinone/menaquinone biosynthesis C-methylase UbiE
VSSRTETFQLSQDQAEVYESRFVPAIFAQWATPLLDAAGVGRGDDVLDVACGTGILARTAADRAAPAGRVVGLDLNEGMLAVAQRLRPDLEWQRGDAADLPFADSTFDAVLCQSALMFFPDPSRALAEMSRVCRPDGTVGVQVYAGLDAQPAYRPWVEMVARLVGSEALSLLGTYWVHGHVDALTRLFAASDLEIVHVTTRAGTAHWSSVDEMVDVEIAATPLAERISDALRQRILEESRVLLAAYATESGAEVPLVGHLVVARRS